MSESPYIHDLLESDSDLESEVEFVSDFEEEIEEFEDSVLARSYEIAESAPANVNEYDITEEGAYQEWIQKYKKQKEEEEELETELRRRLSGETDVNAWKELQSDRVKQDISDQDHQATCITDHPGFRPVCLEKWSLRMAADRLKTKQNQRYRQTGSEDRSVSYREFSRLVYVMLGNKRIPLPSCAYTAIREAFPAAESEAHTGFDLDEES